MGNHTYYLECLKQDLEKAVHRPIHTSSDFDFLYIQLKNADPYAPSVSTLKRLWAYVTSPSRRSASTLNTLSRFLGYSDWNGYVEHLIRHNRVESGFLTAKSLLSQNLRTSDIIELTWAPDRTMLLEYTGANRFRVKSCDNGRLLPGTTFTALAFTVGMPLICTAVTSPQGENLGTYTAGSRNGLTSLKLEPSSKNQSE